MKTEKPVRVKHTITDADRDACLKLSGCGLQTHEIVNIMHISRTTVYTILQAHKACIAKDWSTLQKLSVPYRPTVDWAMKVTGTDKVFLETFGTPDKYKPTDGPVVDTPTDTVDPRNLYEMFEVLCDIRGLLIDIRDMLK